MFYLDGRLTSETGADELYDRSVTFDNQVWGGKNNRLEAVIVGCISGAEHQHLNGTPRAMPGFFYLQLL